MYLNDWLIIRTEPVWFATDLLKAPRCILIDLPIETGRHIGIDRNFRLCNICKSSDIGDEYHYFLYMSCI